MKKRIFCLALALALLCGLLPQMGLTAHAQTISGKCGPSLTFTLDTGSWVLTIKGSGTMWAGAGPGLEFQQAPYKHKIKKVIITGATNVASNFSYMDALETVILGDGVKTIDEDAFGGCKKLKTVQLSSSLETIGKLAFVRCTGLTGITIPSSVKSIEKKAFAECSALQSVTISSGSIGECAFTDCTKLKTVNLQNGVKQIGDMAFQYCSSLESITIPASVNSIGDMPFYGCTALETANLQEGLKDIGGSTFLATGLTEITIPSSVKGVCGFTWCTSLKQATIKKGATAIWDNAFSFCASLNSVSIPNTVKTIGTFAFYQCSSLPGITIPDSVTSLGDKSFCGCSALTNVSIPVSVNSIGEDAFWNCKELKRVTIPASVTSIGEKALGWNGDNRVSGFTIYGYKDSAAQSYAKKNGFSFTSLGSTVGGFLDVTTDQWYSNPVLWAVNNNVTSGTDATHFSPNATVKRGEAMLFFYAAKGRPKFTTTKSPFKDVKKKHWFYDAVLWAVENKITSGTDATHFSPNKTCVRSEILQFLYAAMDKPKYTIANPYSDVKDKHWYKDGAIWAYEKGIEKGENGKFKAKTPCTRAYVVTYLYRFITGKELAK